MKKKSVVVLILLSFWLMYSFVMIGGYYWEAKEYYQTETNRRKELIDYYLDLSAHFLMNQKVHALIPRLEKARSLYEFDFFLLRKNGEVVAFYNNANDLAGINHDYKVLNEFQETNDFALKTIAIFDYKLTLGINKDEATYFWKQMQAIKGAAIRDVALVTFFVFLIVYFILKDIIQISKVLQSKNRRNLSSIQSRSKEAEVMIQAATGLEKSNDSLRADNLLLGSNLAPAIQKELRSGQKPPYSFSCTLVRVDLNGYTQLFMQKSLQDLLPLLSQYFQKSRDLIERYGGLIYQYVGDETIFLFKGDDPEMTSAKALGAIRSLFEAAAAISSPTVPQGLRLKSSLVTGSLTFVQLDEGHAFSGLPLIESVRMLGQVSEKKENSLIFYAESLEHVSELCEVSSQKTTVFKGFERESHLLEVRKFLDLEQAFEVLPLSTVAEVYRGDSDLVRILKELKVFLEEGDEASFFDLATPFRQMQIRDISPGVTEAYKSLLKSSLRLKQDRLRVSKTLASVISLGSIFLRPDNVDKELQQWFDQCEGSTDARVQANTLILKALLELPFHDLEQKLQSTSNRLAADAVLVAGQSEFGQALAERIEDFLSSENPKFVASGLFLISELIRFHHDRDLTYLKTNMHLQGLARKVPEYLEHQDLDVRRRALKSHAQIQKLGLYEN